MDFTKPWEFGDTVFIIEDKKIYANKAVLSMSSEVFKTMFRADFAEKALPEIPLPEKKFDDFLELMQVIHPPNKCIDGNNVNQILPLGHEYQMHHVTKNCEKQLLIEPPSIRNLNVAEKFSLLDLYNVCLEYAKTVPLCNLDKDPDFKMVSSQSLVEIYRHKLEEPSKELLCELMSKPPCISSLILAKKYGLQQLFEKCMLYAKQTPLAKLKSEPDFKKIEKDIQIEILNAKVVKSNEVKSRIEQLLIGQDFETFSYCPNSSLGGHYARSNRSCSDCSQKITTRIEEILKESLNL